MKIWQFQKIPFNADALVIASVSVAFVSWVNENHLQILLTQGVVTETWIWAPCSVKAKQISHWLKKGQDFVLDSLTGSQRPLIVVTPKPEECSGKWECHGFFQPPLSFCDSLVPVLKGQGNDSCNVKIDLEHCIPTKHTRKPWLAV